MFEGLKFHWRLHSLHRVRSSLTLKFDEELMNAAEEKRFPDLDSIRDDAQNELRILDDEIQILLTKRMYEVTHRLSIPMPERSAEEFWEDSYITGRKVLTAQGYSALRSAVRQENRERTEWIRTWLPVGSAIISALAAWVAVLWKHG